MKVITLDRNQQQFKDRVLKRKQNVGCRGVAGFGKSTLIEHSVRGFRSAGVAAKEILCLSFMRSNKEQTEGRLAGECHIKTIDGLCYVAVYRWLAGTKRNPEPNMPSMEEWGNYCRDDNKIERLIQDFAVEYWGLEGRAFTQNQWCAIEDVKKIPIMCMNTLTHPYDWPAIVAMCNHYGLLMPEDDDFTEQAVRYVFEKGQTREALKESWCYEELRYVAATTPDIRFWPYPIVFIDEIQDTNRAHQTIISRCLSDKVYFVGDPDQAVMIFNGADEKAFQTFCARPNTSMVDSPISYRLPRAVVEYAQCWVDRIQAAPYAIQGDVWHIKENELIPNLQAGDMYESRTNLGAISVSLRCIEAGKESYVKGRSIGRDMGGLQTTLEKDKAYRWEDTVNAVRRWQQQQVAILYAKYQDVPPEQVSYVHDRAASLERLYMGAVQEGVCDPFLFRQYLDQRFTDNPNREDVVLCLTGHKAKGDQNKTVFLSASDLKPRLCQSEALSQAERNLVYVMLTRPEETLFIVEEDPLKD